METAGAFSLVTFIRSLGNLLGPALGGLLADPANLYPSLFSPDSIWSKWRYLLPNLVVASMQLCMAAGVLLLLSETNQAVSPSRRDPLLLLLRRRLRQCFRKGAARNPHRCVTYMALPENDNDMPAKGVTEGPHELEAQTASTSNPPPPQQVSRDLADREQQYVQQPLKKEETSATGIFTSQMILQISSISSFSQSLFRRRHGDLHLSPAVPTHLRRRRGDDDGESQRHR
jgi:hypothetical protein